MPNAAMALFSHAAADSHTKKEELTEEERIVQNRNVVMERAAAIFKSDAIKHAMVMNQKQSHALQHRVSRAKASVHKRKTVAERKLQTIAAGPPPSEDVFHKAGLERAAAAASARSPDKDRSIDTENPVNVRPCIDSSHWSRKLCGSSLEQKKMRLSQKSTARASTSRPASRPASRQTCHSDSITSPIFKDLQKLEWETMQKGLWRPKTPSVLGALKLDPTGPMCLDSQLAKWPFQRIEEKHRANENVTHSNYLIGLEHDLVAKCSAKPLVHNPSKYKQVVNDMLREPKLAMLAQSEANKEHKMTVPVRTGIVCDSQGHTAVKVHNAWIFRCNSR